MITYSVSFFMGTKVFVNLTHFKWPQNGLTYLNILVWSEHLIKKKHVEYFEKQLRYFSLFYQERYKVQFKHKCAKQVMTCSMFSVHIPSTKTTQFFFR